MRTDGRQDISVAVLGTLILAAAAVALAVLGMRTGHLDLAPSPSPTNPPTAQPLPSNPSLPAEPPPAADPTLPTISPDPELEVAFAEQSAALEGSYALAWVDRTGLHVLGAPPDDTAWSTIKVPLAIAALTHAEATGTNLAREVEAAVTRSDNVAAEALWSSLGSAQDAARAVDEVLDAYDSGQTVTESERVRPPFSSYGQTQWSLLDQARFAAALACADDDSTAGQVRAAMSRTVPEQRWGIGELDSAHLKGGWGPDGSGAYVLRQFGDGTVGGRRYAVAVCAQSDTGSYAQAGADLSRLVQWWAAQVVGDAPGLSCPASG